MSDMKPVASFAAAAEDKLNRRFGILTGLAAEARLLRGAGTVCCAAADGQVARRMMRDMIGSGITHAVSFGLCGGLEPGLPSGSIVIASHVAGLGMALDCNNALVAEMAALLPGAQVGGIWGTDAAVAGVRDKAQLYRRSHCLAVDMESHIVAELAADARLPFIALRVVCDPAEFPLPPAALVPLKRGGVPDMGSILRSLLRRPGQIGGMLGLARHHHRAMRGLAEAASAII
ncbi:MAG: phosphorylase [Alphaproteobacteria bacterium]